MKLQKGFTLIELLVVISIIALLLSILMPGLNLAKKKASSVACLSNAKQLSLAWFMYAEDYDSRVLAAWYGVEHAWIQQPQKENGAKVDPLDGAGATDEDEIRGIEKGLLFPYVGTSDVFHCPGDKLRKRVDGSKIFNSYSIALCVGGGGIENLDTIPAFTKMTEITSPGGKYVFVENGERNRNFNWGGYWQMATPGSGAGFWGMWEPLAISHGEAAIFGFADGHAENIRWHDTVVLDHYNRTEDSQYYGALKIDPGESEDFDWLVRGWAYRRYNGD